jgi:hypothetical protein
MQVYVVSVLEHSILYCCLVERKFKLETESDIVYIKVELPLFDCFNPDAGPSIYLLDRRLDIPQIQ